MKANKVMCMGDSLTEGFGIQTELAWPFLVAEALQIEVVNCGVSGDTTGGMLARFSAALTRCQPSHVIIMGGTNDLWMNLPFNMILSNIMAMTRQARFSNVTAFVGIPSPCFSLVNNESPNQIFLTGEEFVSQVKSFQRYLHQAMTLDGMLTIDFSDAMSVELFLLDGVHPNRDGHKQMASIVAKSIQSHLT